MSTSPPNSFDDPALKAAVCRVWGAETAPAALRQRVEAMGIGAGTAPAADVTPAQARPRPSAWIWPLRYPRPLYALAAALMMVIGFTVAYRMDQPPAWRSVSPASTASVNLSPSSTLPTVMPASMAERLLAVHNRCAAEGEHNAFNGVARTDFATLRSRLEEELGFPVLVGPIDSGADRWQFRGASVCSVGGIPAAHVVFTRKGQAVSVFTLPRSTCPQARGGEVCEDPDPVHPLTVLVRPEVVHCVVGSSANGSLSPQELRAICARLRPYLPE